MKPKENKEDYPKDWVRIELMVSPKCELHAISGDREEGEGDQPYIGLERIVGAISWGALWNVED